MGSPKIKTIDDLLGISEGQVFERKSAKADERTLGNEIIAFANADGGTLVIGIEDDGVLSGFRAYPKKENKIRAFIPEWIRPPIKLEISEVLFDTGGNIKDKVLLISVDQSSNVYENQRGEAYRRIGSQSKLLNFEERQLLVQARGLQNFEAEIVEGVGLESLDQGLLKKYAEIMGNSDSRKLLFGRHLAESKDGNVVLNNACILLFAPDPQKFVNRAEIRVLRYEGRREETGEHLNLIKDERIGGPLVEQIEGAKALVSSVLRDFTYLDRESEKFKTAPEYPLFAWTEAIVNAVAHREYSVSGFCIEIKLFEDRMEVISPGDFPSVVREDNIKDNHFSRNPRVARVLSDFGYVEELGEGVNRMYEEMESAGLPEPQFKSKDGKVIVSLFNDIENRRPSQEIAILNKLKHSEIKKLSRDEKKVLLYVLENGKITTRECMKTLSKGQHTAIRILKKLNSYSSPFLIDHRKFDADPRAYYDLNSSIVVVEGDVPSPEILENPDTGGAQRTLI